MTTTSKAVASNPRLMKQD